MAASLINKIIGPLSNPSQNLSKCFLRCYSSIQPSLNSSVCQNLQSTSTIYSSSCLPKTGATSPGIFHRSLLQVCAPFMTPVRTMVRYSRRRGMPKSVKATLDRFLRLDWGIYIRPRAGRHKHAWKKPEWIREMSKYHVFCNKQQSRMLDKMRTEKFKKKRYYVDDPYEPYQKRSGVHVQFTPPKYVP